MTGGCGINRFERFSRVKKQKLLFAKIRNELRLFQTTLKEIEKKAERD